MKIIIIIKLCNTVMERLTFSGSLIGLFSLFYVIREFDKFLHRGWAHLNVLSFFHNLRPCFCCYRQSHTTISANIVGLKFKA